MPENGDVERSGKRCRYPLGAKNPYAVARLLTNGKVPAWETQSAKKNRADLAKIMGGRLPYHQLFDPAYGSCLFPTETVRGVRGSLPEDAAGVANGGDYPTGRPNFGACAIASYNSIANYRWTYNGASFDDPVQGPIKDCYLIATLSSLAWLGKINAAITTNISFFFSSKVLCVGPRAATVSPCTDSVVIAMPPKLPLDASGNPAGATSKDFAANKEIWPSYYEMAYGIFRELSKNDTGLPQITSYDGDRAHPNICRLGEDTGPCPTLRLLTTTRDFTNDTLYDMMAGRSRDPDAVWSWLESKLCAVEAPPTTAAYVWSRKARYPAVALTNCTGDPAATGVPAQLCSAPTNSGVIYDEELLVANHSYSLLGLHIVKTTTGTNKYVILRNPYGTNWGWPGNPRYTLATGQLNFKYPTAYTFPLFATSGSNTTPNAGVFAMDYRNFAKWFGAFCYVPL